jgi:hypothetical protein
MTRRIPKTLFRAYGITVEEFPAKVDAWSVMRRAQLEADARYPPQKPKREDYPGAEAYRAARDRYDYAMKHRAEVFIEPPPEVATVVVLALNKDGFPDYEITEAEEWLT